MLPVVLAYVAGYVDGCTFVALFGLFVAQVTGSFVFAGAIVAYREHGTPIKLLAVPAFILGAAAATAIDSISRHRKWRGAPILLGLEALLLAAMLATALCAPEIDNSDQPAALVAGLLGLSAMGVQNAFVRLRIQGSPSTNVMTTNTAQLAIDATEWLATAMLTKFSAIAPSRAETDPNRRRLTETALIIAAFLAGTISGIFACQKIGFVCLALPLALVSTAAMMAARTAIDK